MEYGTENREQGARGEYGNWFFCQSDRKTKAELRGYYRITAWGKDRRTPLDTRSSPKLFFRKQEFCIHCYRHGDRPGKNVA